MWNIILNILFAIMTSEAMKNAIALGVSKLLAHKKDGITKEIAIAMIEGIKKSEMNPTSQDVFDAALKQLQEDIDERNS